MSRLTKGQKRNILNKKVPINRIDYNTLYFFLKEQNEELKDAQDYASYRGREILSLKRKVESLETQLDLCIRFFMKNTSFHNYLARYIHSDTVPDNDNGIYVHDELILSLYKQYPQLIQELVRKLLHDG